MITVSKIENDCKPCRKRKTVEKKKQFGLLTTMILVILPKCPFCVMAYSGTILLCGKAGGVSELASSSSTTIFITLFFCLLVLLSIFFNYRDARTKYALLLAVAGSAMIMYSVSVSGGLSLYYTGVIFVFVGVWLNASLLYIISRITGRKKILPE
jgi:CDP-diglyceride synthetase